MKLAKMLSVSVALLFSIGSVMATPPGKTVEFAGGGKGKVVFVGKTHADKGLKCGNCHSKPMLFIMKKGANKITMTDINAGKFCGACHDGKKAFKASDAANCGKCHMADSATGAKAETPLAASDCASKAVSKDGKPLAGAAKAAFLKKCGAEAKSGK